MALRDGFDARSRELADLLQEWDVLGVYEDSDERPEDEGEYDDLVEPLRAWLTEGPTAHELSARLVDRLFSHYGLNQMEPDSELEFAQRVLRWWSVAAD